MRNRSIAKLKKMYIHPNKIHNYTTYLADF